jgi:arylsulfatase A-like enzyme
VKANSVCNTPVHVIDWYPTLLTAASASPDLPTDGVNLIPLLRGESLPARPLFWHMPLYDLLWASTPAAVVRAGDWKLIEFFGDRFDAAGRYHVGQHSELYNLRQDIGESTNLAAAHPEKVAQLRQQLRNWLASMPAEIPVANPHFDSRRAILKTKQKQPWQQ